jgi:hypothetical protein
LGLPDLQGVRFDTALGKPSDRSTDDCCNAPDDGGFD